METGEGSSAAPTHAATMESSAEHIIMCHACKGEFSSINDGYELTNCKHGFCKTCLGAAVAESLLVVMQNADDLPLDSIYGMLSCPLEACGCTLSRQDLRFVVGPSILHMLDLKVASMITHKVILPLLRICPMCKSDSPQMLLRPHTDLNSLRFVSLYNVLVSIGAPLSSQSYTHSDLVQLLQQAAPASFLCPQCLLFLCQNCGANLGPLSELEPVHVCDPSQMQCFKFARSMLSLYSAYAHATYTPGKKTRKAIFSSLFTRKPKQQGTPSPPGCKSSVEGLIYEGCLEKRFEVQGMATKEQEVEEDFKLRDSQSKATGCLSSATRRHNRATTREKHAKQADKQAQRALEDLTRSITETDHSGPPPLIVALLCVHDLPHTVLKWLVQNQSLMDIISRRRLYHDLLSFLRALSSSQDLLPFLCGSKTEHDCWGATTLRLGMRGSLILDLEIISKQAQFMNRWVKQENMGLESINMVRDIEATYGLLCKRVKVWEVALSQHQWLADGANDEEEVQQNPQLLITQLKSLIPSNKPWVSKSSSDLPKSDLNLSEALIDTYKTALRPFQFDEGCLLPSHYFRKKVEESLHETMLNKKRALAISKEMAELNTLLPLEWDSSIFVRMDEQRSDVLRALIIGPRGTPYENGVFLFDVWLGKGYPDEPPKVQFLTTGGGKVRFNPNLYKNGMVCLSILGTWNGPGWKPGVSSILQVLVSIQALVLVEDPFYNEPGMGSGIGQVLFNTHREAENYRKDQRRNTLLYSMLPALRCPDPLFELVIHTHFRLKAPYIVNQCTTWIEQESRREVKQTLVSCLLQLRYELDNLN